MRKDPPFDMEYVYSTYLLEAAEREGARVFNRPRAIRDHNEKLAIAEFPEFTAPTLVTRDRASCCAASSTSTHDVILKPLDGMGGSSIFRVRARRCQPQRDHRDDGASTARAAVMAQRFIPEIVDGDKRITAHRRRAGAALRSRAFPSRARRAATWPPAAAAWRAAHGARSRDRREALGARAVGGGPARRRPRRDRRLPDRGQRDQSDRASSRSAQQTGIRRRRRALRRRWNEHARGDAWLRARRRAPRVLR